MREGKRVLPGESPEEFWDMVIGFVCSVGLVVLGTLLALGF